MIKGFWKSLNTIFGFYLTLDKPIRDFWVIQLNLKKFCQNVKKNINRFEISTFLESNVECTGC